MLQKCIILPAELWEDERINLIDKALLIDVVYNETPTGGYKVTNKQLSSRLDITEDNINSALQNLLGLNYIVIYNEGKNNRVIISNVDGRARERVDINQAETKSSTKVKRKRKQLVPLDWRPAEYTEDKFYSLYKDYDLQEAIDYFINGCHAKGNRYVNHDSAFMNWVKNGIAWGNLIKKSERGEATKVYQTSAERLQNNYNQAIKEFVEEE